MLHLWPLLLPVAAYSGWRLARHSEVTEKKVHKKPLKKPKNINPYVEGLNYLLNEQSDKAVDVFIQLLETDNETIETHLILGSLFRRRGETDRAIRIHQNLMARPLLNKEQKIEALMALGRDYLSAGFIDRAERIFQELSTQKGKHQRQSFYYLTQLYQQEKAWEKCIEAMQRLKMIKSESNAYHLEKAIPFDNLDHSIAHYYCECAEKIMPQKKAADFLHQALQVDKNSVRASLLLGHLAMTDKAYSAAIKWYKNVKKQDPDYLSEVIEPLISCYQQLGQEEECVQYFKETFREHPRVSLLFFLAEHIKKQEGMEPALDFLIDQLHLYPSIKGLNQLVTWYLGMTYGKVHAKLQMLHPIMTKLLSDKPIYRCLQCGYGGKYLYWLCPGCKEWSVMKPVHGLEGD